MSPILCTLFTLFSGYKPLEKLMNKPVRSQRSGGKIQAAHGLGPTDAFVIATPDGYKSFDQHQMQALFGAATTGGVAITRWDVHGDEKVLPFTLEAVANCEVDDTTLMLEGGCVSSYRALGGLPSDGVYWFSVTSDVGGPAARHSIYFGPVDIHIANDRVRIVDADDNTLELPFGEVLCEVNMLVVLDIESQTVAVHLADQNGSMALTTPLAGQVMRGAYYNAGGAAMVEYNVAQFNDAPAEVDGAWEALRLVDAVRPGWLVSGTIFEATSSGFSRDTLLHEGNRYIAFEDEFMQLPTVDMFHRVDAQIASKHSLLVQDCKIDLTPRGGVIGPVHGDWVSEPVSRKAWVLGDWMGPEATVLEGAVLFGGGGNSLKVLQQSVMLGYDMAQRLHRMDTTVAIGHSVLSEARHSRENVFVGDHSASAFGYDFRNNVAVGTKALQHYTDPAGKDQPATLVTHNTALGDRALCGAGASHYNTAVGSQAGYTAASSVHGDRNTAIGAHALGAGRGPRNDNLALGHQAMYQFEGGEKNVAVGGGALQVALATGNAAVGHEALGGGGGKELSFNTALGYRAMYGASNVSHSTAVGAFAQPLGDHQIQLGTSHEQIHAFGGVYQRTDARDVSVVGKLGLGLEFILSLEPVEYKRDPRERYIDYNGRPERPAPLPQLSPGADAEQIAAWQSAHKAWEKAVVEYPSKLKAWEQANSITTIESDGSRCDTLSSFGFVGDSLQHKSISLGTPFGGLRTVKVDGVDVLTSDDTQLIAPIVRAVQELNDFAHSEQLVDRIARRVLQLLKQQEK